MKKFLLILLFTLAQFISLNAYTVTGKLVDQNSTALSGYTVKMYINPSIYTTTSATNGTFTFNNVTEVSDEQLPSDYSVSNNYPNPFNPATRIEVTLPKAGRIKIELFNTIGERVQNIIEKDVSAGKSYIELELNGMPNGAYLAKINIDDKYTIIKKIMLLYRSQHLSISNPNSNFQLGKISEATKIDSIVVTWSTLGRKTFTNPGSLVDGTKNLGNLVIELSSISGNAIYASTTIPVSGVTVNIDDQYYTTSSDGKFQLNYLTQGIKNLKATKEGYDPFTKTVNIIVGTNLPLNIQMTSALFTHNLYGNIVNANDLKPIEGVIVSILNDDGTTSNLQTTSDFLGYYQVPTVPQGNRNVRFTRSSYKTKTVQLSISNSNYQYNAGLQPICLTPSVVYQNQTYNTVPIGDQCWLRENLNVGTRIPGGQNQANNSIIEKYCYNNDTINCNDGGGLYHWKEAMQYSTTEGTQGICPNGWHIPTHAELQTLTNAVNNDGNKLKRSDQGTGNGLGTDSSGFSALLAGGRDWVGNFSYLGYYATFWSSTEYDATHAYSMRLNGVTGSIHFYYGYKEDGFSVRCLKD